MKRLRTSGFILFSFILHVLFIGLLFMLRQHTPRSRILQPISFNLTTAESPETESIEARDEPSLKPPTEETESIAASSSREKPQRTLVYDPIADFDTLYHHVRLEDDTLSLFDQEAWKQHILDFLKREKLVSIDVTTSPDSNRLIFSPGEYTIPPAARDGIADMLTQRAGGSPQFSATELIAGLARNIGAKEQPPRFDFLPSRVQVASLAHMYEHRNATQMEIYGAVDEHATTAEHLNRNLDHLVKKGWLKKKKISPENILSFFGIPIEMSRKNVLNPLYIYEPQVDRSTLISYLQSRLYLLKEQAHSRADSLRIQPRIDSLNRQIQALIPR